MSREKNTRYLLKATGREVDSALRAPPWLVFCVLVWFVGAPFLWDRASLALSSVPRSAWGVIAGVTVAAVVAFFRWQHHDLRRQEQRFALTLRGPDSSAVLSWLERDSTVRTLPDGDALVAATRAHVHTLFGEEDAARRELASVTWSGRAPLIQAEQLMVEACLALLCSKNISLARTLARRAQELSALPSSWPGAAVKVSYLDVLRAAAELAAGRSSEELYEVLERGSSARHLYTRLLAAWGLAQSDEPERAATGRRILHAEAPHARGLHAA